MRQSAAVMSASVAFVPATGPEYNEKHFPNFAFHSLEQNSKVMIQHPIA